MIELVAPAGNLEKLKFALHYGADAVYIGGKDYSLRAQADNFSIADIKASIEFAHERGRKVYLAMNIFAHNVDITGIRAYLEELAAVPPDALIVSDPGVFNTVRSVLPEVPVHISTQANVTNTQSADFWFSAGAKRIVLARELSVEEIKEITQKRPGDYEMFIHGAMCMSYSGRCLISDFLTGRGANVGDCTHPCRWKYAVSEEKRDGEYFPVEQDARGTYFFNSKDLCLIEHLPRIIDAGIQAVKIEGRMKGFHYLGSVIRIYREAIDAYYENPENYCLQADWQEELKMVSHRDYTTGFFLGKPDDTANNYGSSGIIKGCDFLGIVTSVKNGTAKIDVRGKFTPEDTLRVVRQKRAMDFSQKAGEILDEHGNAVPFTKPNTFVTVRFENHVEVNDLLRKV